MSRNQEIGAAVRELRGDLPQVHVARLMADLGWKWSQATVWSVETGERPLRLAEADDLAQVLDVSVGDFLRQAADDFRRRRIEAHIARIDREVAALAERKETLRLLLAQVTP